MPSFRHGKNTVVLFGSLNASPFLNEAATSRTLETAESTAFGDLNKTYIVGLGDGTVSLSGMFDNSNGGLDNTVNAETGGANDVFTIQVNGSAAGEAAQLIQGQLSSYEINPTVGDIVTVSAEIQASGSIGSINGGKVISSSTVNLTASNSSASTTGIDFQAAATNGAIGHLHVTSNTGNNVLALKLQDSADNTTFTDLITFTNVSASSATAERVEVSGNIKRFVRAVVTSSLTAGSATYNVSFARR
jgi:hypothetical protein